MTLRIGDIAPDFKAETTEGPIQFHNWMEGGWTVFFSHPKDFTPICTTEIGLMARLADEFEKRDTRIIGHSIDPVSEHLRWLEDIVKIEKVVPNFPIIGDENLEVAKLYDMLPAEAVPGVRTPADNATVRAVFIIGPDKKIRATSFYPMTLGRNFDEVLRALDSLQITAEFKLATPVNWTRGMDLVIPPAISNEEAAKLFPKGWKNVTPYLRVIEAKNIFLRG